MKNNNFRKVTVFKLIGCPREISIPEELIADYEENVFEFSEVEASSFLEIYLPHTGDTLSPEELNAIANEELESTLIMALKKEIADAPGIKQQINTFLETL